MRSVTIRQVENGYVMDMESEAACYPYASIVMPTETTKVFVSLEDALKEVVKWMVPNAKDASIHVSV
jgi:hypothetical protein